MVSRLAVRVGGAAARRAKTTILLWVLAVIGCIVGGALAGTHELTHSGVGESARADRIVERAGLSDPSVESVLVRTSDPAATLRLAGQLEARLRNLHGDVASVAGPDHDRALLTDGGRVALVRATLGGESDDDASAAVAAAVAATQRSAPQATLAQSGPGSLDRAASSVVDDGLRQAELISLPVTLLILLLAFGSFVAALVPLGFGLTTVAAALGALGPISQVVPQAGATSSIVLLVGLAVSVDYSLFYLRRERSERRGGATADAALHAASATVGRAILISALTVLVSLAGLFLSGSVEFVSVACGTIVVVAIAGLGSVTVLPAVLSLLGDRVERGRLPRLRRARRTPARGPATRLAAAVTRRPLLALATSLVLLGALAVPALSLRTSDSGAGLSAANPTARASALIEHFFPGAPDAAEVVVSGRDLGAAGPRRALAALGRSATEVTGGSSGTPTPRISRDGSVALLDVALPVRGQAADRRAFTALREHVRAGAANVQPGARALVTGDVAGSVDWSSRVDHRLPLVVGFVLAIAFLLVLAAFRSALLALTMMALGGLSVASAYGVLVLVFQGRWAESLLGFTSTGAIVSWLPLFAFTILFGLSMDYTVLILERIREGRADGLGAREATAAGLAATSGAVTSAAVIMVAVFSIFATLPLLEFKQLGIGMASAILIDATIVRSLALPAVVCLLGERGWKVRTLPFGSGRTPRLRERWDTPVPSHDQPAR
jgi:uncharacterized membrane protein YdfJ with MMPL/SSD domain